MMRVSVVCYGLLAVLLCSVTQAENWPRFRGPNGTAISSETGFPITWTEKDYAWTINLPEKSHSSPVIWGENLYLTTAMKEGKVRRLICLNAATGKQRWERDLSLDSVHLHKKNSFASGSPATNGEKVVVAFADEKNFIVAGFSSQGDELWRKNLGEFTSQHGPACSPVIHEKYVIIAKDMMGPSSVYALDLNTGKLIWETKREFRRTSYATPVIRKRKDGVMEVICVSGQTGITGLELATGKTIWKSEEFPMRTVGSPVIAGDLVIATCGSGGSGKLLMAIPLDQKGELKPKYTITRKLPYAPTPLYKNGRLFMLLDRGMIKCVKAADGKEIWTERISGNFSGSPIWLENRLYAIDEDGTVVVMSVANEFKELGRVSLGETSFATPAVANGRMYLKTATKLFCIKAK